MNDNNFCFYGLEQYQMNNLNFGYHLEKLEQNFYNGYEPQSINNYSLSKLLNEKEQTEAYDKKKIFLTIKIPHYYKANANVLLNKKRNMVSKSKPAHETNLDEVKFGSGNHSKANLFKTKKYENVNTNVNIIQLTKEKESNKTCTQGMANKSAELTALTVNILPKESNKVSIQTEMDIKFLEILIEAHNRPENNNITKEELKNNLTYFLKEKIWSEILNRNGENESGETKRLLGIYPLDYFNELINKNYSEIQQNDEDDKLVRLYHLNYIFKNKEESYISYIYQMLKKYLIKKNKKYLTKNISKYLNPLYLKIVQKNYDDNDENEIKRINKKGNLKEIIKHWIQESFLEDFEEISGCKLEKEGQSQSKKEDNNTKESKSDFFNTNFESFFKDYHRKNKEKVRGNKKQIFDYLNKIKQEKNPEDYLIKMKMLDYLSKIKDEKFEKILEKDKEDQEYKYKTEKCRKALYKIYQSKNLEKLLILCDQFYIDKNISIKIRDPEDFEKKIRRLEEYKDFKLDLSKSEIESIQDRKRKFKIIVTELLGCLTKTGIGNNKSK